VSHVPGTSRAAPVLGPVPTQPPIVPLITDDLDRVELLFRNSLESPLRLVNELGSFVSDAGGKRVRPTLHLLCAKLCGYVGPNAVLLATVLEFIHSATLIHDDVIDGAATRRGQESVNRRWGNAVTVLFGDYLFAKAMELALRARSLDVMERLADVTLRMTEGEMLQTRYAGRLDLTVDEYLDLVERKTAALFSCCCELAAVIAGTDTARREALSRYGRNLGMAFQVVDDVLDFTGTTDRLGKPAASDLREGKATLAVLELLGSRSPLAGEGKELAQRVVDSAGSDPADIARLTELLVSSGAIQRARRIAERHAAAAVAELEAFPDGPARRALAAVPHALLARDR
jgi:octaprenyl-diphosphate synthase